VVTGRVWSSDELRLLDGTRELQLAVEHTDGGTGPWVTVWVVRVGADAYVRTWHRRDTGWYGGVLRSRRARVRLGAPRATEVGVAVEDVGARDTELTTAVDAAYRDRYGPGAGSMVTAASASSTLRLVPTGR